MSPRTTAWSLPCLVLPDVVRPNQFREKNRTAAAGYPAPSRVPKSLLLLEGR
jgi:hypothetical protein